MCGSTNNHAELPTHLSRITFDSHIQCSPHKPLLICFSQSKRFDAEAGITVFSGWHTAKWPHGALSSSHFTPHGNIRRNKSHAELHTSKHNSLLCRYSRVGDGWTASHHLNLKEKVIESSCQPQSVST